MNRSKLWMFGVVLMLVGGRASIAQNVEPTGKGSAGGGGESLTFVLMDGTIFVGKPSMPDVTIDTEFGPLKVPVNEILSMTPGFQSHPDFERALRKHIEVLGAPDEAQRSRAQ